MPACMAAASTAKPRSVATPKGSSKRPKGTPRARASRAVSQAMYMRLARGTAKPRMAMGSKKRRFSCAPVCCAKSNTRCATMAV